MGGFHGGHGSGGSGFHGGSSGGGFDAGADIADAALGVVDFIEHSDDIKERMDQLDRPFYPSRASANAHFVLQMIFSSACLACAVAIPLWVFTHWENFTMKLISIIFAIMFFVGSVLLFECYIIRRINWCRDHPKGQEIMVASNPGPLMKAPTQDMRFPKCQSCGAFVSLDDKKCPICNSILKK